MVEDWVSLVDTPGNDVDEAEKRRSGGDTVDGLSVTGEATSCLETFCCGPVIPAQTSDARASGSVARLVIEAEDDSLVLGREGEARGLWLEISLDERIAGLNAVSDVDAGAVGVGEVLRRRVSSEALRR